MTFEQVEKIIRKEIDYYQDLIEAEINGITLDLNSVYRIVSAGKSIEAYLEKIAALHSTIFVLKEEYIDNEQD